MKEQIKHSIPADIISQARMSDLYTFLNSSGLKMTKAGYNRYNVTDIPGITILNNVYFYFYDDSWGNAVDFLTNFLNYDFKEAVYALTGFSTPLPIHSLSNTVKIAQTASEPFVMPLLNDYEPRVIAYLNKSRSIHIGLIKSFINHKLLFQTKEYGNCLFPWYFNGEIVGAEVVGTLDKKRFKKILIGSKGGYGFNFSHPKSTSINYLYFFESAIDLMSYLSLYKIEYNILYISMAGLKPSKIEFFSNLYPKAEIHLCLDNDNVANKFIKNLGDMYSFEITLPPSPYKDFNDQLRNIN